MNVTFVNPGVDDMVEKIMGFQTEEMSAFWSEPLYHFYPQLDKGYAAALPFPQRKAYIERIMRAIYQEKEPELREKTARYAAHWAACKAQITAAMSDAFQMDGEQLFNDLRCNVSLNPIAPRFLREHCFDIFYLNSEKGAIGQSIHEIIHFFWFEKWHGLFGGSYDDYERPSLPWILSEMVVESIMRDPRLSTINPYFPREQGGCIYPYFFDMKVDGALVLNTLDAMYRAQSMADFMKNSYAYCQRHEAAIRAHIRRAEEAP